MTFNSNDWGNKIKLTIDSSKVDEDLTDFPVLITLSSGTGITSYDTTAVFDELEPDTVSGTAVSGTYDSYTKLMLHMDGEDDGILFTDNSESNHTITRYNALTKIGIKKFGSASGYFDGTGDYLSIPDSDDWNFGSDDFTIEAWIYVSSTTYVPIYSQVQDTGSNANRIMYGYWGGNWNFFVATNSTLINAMVADTLPTGSWIHVALTRSGSNFRFFRSGVQIGATQVDADSVPNNSGNAYIGAARLSSTFPIVITGYVDELRISKGIARWTSNFIPPTGPYGSSWDNRKKITITTTVSGIETELYTEIELWDSANEQAWLWTKVPTIASGIDTDLYLYYDTTMSGNDSYIGDTGEIAAQNVWDNDFVGVWHMAQDPTGDIADAIKDSTSNENDGTPGGTMLTEDLVDGKVGKALDFDGGDDRLNLGNNLSAASDFTISAIVKTSNVSLDYQNIMAKASGATMNYGFYLKTDEVHFQFYTGGWKTHTSTTANLIAGIFYFVTLVFDVVNNTVKMYVNDTEKYFMAETTNPTPNAYSAYIGNDSGAEWFTGIIDEVRFSTVVQTAASVKATYYSNWDNLITFSDADFVNFYFSSPVPVDLSTVYGYQHLLKVTVTVSGSVAPSYNYNADFYDIFGSKIGSTVSGVSSGSQATSIAYLPTPSGAVDYQWYVYSTCSGYNDTSPTYTFTNMFLCSGYTEVDGSRASGIPVRLYRRDTGAYIGGTVSTGIDGTFQIPTSHTDYHYAIAIHPTDEYRNLEAFDWLKPTIS